MEQERVQLGNSVFRKQEPHAGEHPIAHAHHLIL